MIPYFIIAQVFVHRQGRVEHTEICTESHPAVQAASQSEQEYFSLFFDQSLDALQDSRFEVVIYQTDSGYVVGRRVGWEFIALPSK